MTIHMSNISNTFVTGTPEHGKIQQLKETEFVISSANIAVSELNKIIDVGVSMSHLLAILAMVIESSKLLRTEVLMNRINEAEATAGLAHILAADKKIPLILNSVLI